MCKRGLDRLISPAVTEVLETMFFSGIQEGEVEPGSMMMCVRVPFDGQIPGMVEIRISEPSARTLAASFLGEEEVPLTGVHVDQMVCELANMICGAIVSHPEFGGKVALGSPEFVTPAGQEPAGNTAVGQGFVIENGTLSVLLYTCAPA